MPLPTYAGKSSFFPSRFTNTSSLHFSAASLIHLHLPLAGAQNTPYLHPHISLPFLPAPLFSRIIMQQAPRSVFPTIIEASRMPNLPLSKYYVACKQRMDIGT